MVTRARIDIPEQRVAEFCDQWCVSELDLFGSVLRDDFHSDSDVDVLVTFSDGARWTLFDLARMEAELAAILGRHVDIVDRRSLNRSENYIKRRSILGSLERVYGAR